MAGTQPSCKQGQHKNCEASKPNAGTKKAGNQTTPRTFRGHRITRGHPIGIAKNIRKQRLDVGLSFA